MAPHLGGVAENQTPDDHDGPQRHEDHANNGADIRGHVDADTDNVGSEE